jgi:hypothetical protein
MENSSKKSLQEVILEYVNRLDPDEYMNIANAMKSETSKQRVLEIIERKLHTGCKIKDCVMQIEVSLYDVE